MLQLQLALTAPLHLLRNLTEQVLQLANGFIVVLRLSPKLMLLLNKVLLQKKFVWEANSCWDCNIE